MPPTAASATIDLRPSCYQASLNHFRNMVADTDGAKIPFYRVAVRTPNGETVDLQVRVSNLYVVGFLGEDKWYSFDGEVGGWGPSCGIGSNYNDLGSVGKVMHGDLNSIGNLARFRKRRDELDKRIIAILIAVVSEATRFATVATYFTGLTNSVRTNHADNLSTALSVNAIDFELLKTRYFNQWQKPPSQPVQPGQVVHFTPQDILLKHR